MQSPATLSAQAKRFLADAPQRPPTRSLKSLPQIRAAGQQRALQNAARIVRATGVNLKTSRIGEVGCLEVTPANSLADWSILYGFGGGFVEGSAVEDLQIIAALCQMTGARVIAPEYRLAPEHPWPAAIEDVFAVYARMAETPFAIVGESAGGNLALCLMQRACAEGMTLPRATALLSPWCDLTADSASLAANDGRDPALTAQSSRFAALHYLAGHAATDPEASPLFGAFDQSWPPTIITTGTRDLLLHQATDLAHRMQGSGVRVDLRVWEDLWHVFEWYEDIPEAGRSLQQIAAFLAENMG